jgi:hypothetical protein
MMGRRGLVGSSAATVILVALAGAACDSPDPEPETTRGEPEAAVTPHVPGQGFAADFDACDLVSTDEAAEAAGRAVVSPRQETAAILATCAYPTGDGMMPAVILEIRPDDTMYETAREMLAGGPDPVEEVEGIGDRAFYGTMAGYHTVTLAAAGRFAVVSVARDRDADNKQKALDLGRLVAGRL